MATKISRQTIARAVVRQLLADGARQHDIMNSLAAYLALHHMTQHADSLINDIADEIFKRTGRLSVEITSARILTDNVRHDLSTYLMAETQAQSVDLFESVDAGLIGGLVVRTPSAELDVSVRTKLRELTAIV